MDDEIKDILINMHDPDFEEKERVWKYIERLRAERRWIPVSERLPEDGQRVLSYDPRICEDDWIACVAFTGGKFVGESGYGPPMYDYEPTHWMPLPEPPEAK